MTELEIIETKENVLLDRIDYIAYYHHEGAPTPKREIRTKIAANINKDEDKLAIVSITPQFGKGVSKIIFHVYNSAENMKKVEREHILKRNKLIKEEKEEKKA